jgi:hypothetical protein
MAEFFAQQQIPIARIIPCFSEKYLAHSRMRIYVSESDETITCFSHSLAEGDNYLGRVASTGAPEYCQMVLRNIEDVFGRSPQTSALRKLDNKPLTDGALRELLTLQRALMSYDQIPQAEQSALSGVFASIQARAPPVSPLAGTSPSTAPALAQAVYEYAVTPASGFSEAMRAELVRLYTAAHTHWRYDFFLTLYNGDHQALERELWSQATTTGRTFSQMVLGAVGPESIPQPQDLGLAVAFPTFESDDSAFVTDYTLLGGGGFNTSGVARSFLQDYLDLPLHERTHLMVTVIAACLDDGGNSLDIRELLRKVFGVHLPAVGDPFAAVLFLALEQWLTDNPDYFPTFTQRKPVAFPPARARFNLKKAVEAGLSFEALVRQRLQSVHAQATVTEKAYVASLTDPSAKATFPLETPRDWLFFASNVLAASRIIDEVFLQKGLMTEYTNAAGGNLLTVAAAIDSGVVTQGKLDPSSGLNKLLEMFGVEGGLVVLGSYDTTIDEPGSVGFPVMVATFEDGHQVVSQTDITDKEHDQLITQAELMRVVETNKKGQPIKAVPLEMARRPRATSSVIRLIRNTRKALMVGAGSPITSLLPLLLLQDTAYEMAKRTDIARLYVFKPIYDLETSTFAGGFRGLSIPQIITLTERSIQLALNDTNIRFQDIFSHVVIPMVPQETADLHYAFGRQKALTYKLKDSTGKEDYVFTQAARDEIAAIPAATPYEEVVARICAMLADNQYLTAVGQQGKATKDIKPSKALNHPVLRATPADIAYCQERGLTVYVVDKPTDFYFWPDKLHYNPDSIRDHIKAIAEGYQSPTGRTGVQPLTGRTGVQRNFPSFNPSLGKIAGSLIL